MLHKRMPRHGELCDLWSYKLADVEFPKNFILQIYKKIYFSDFGETCDVDVCYKNMLRSKNDVVITSHGTNAAHPQLANQPRPAAGHPREDANLDVLPTGT